MLDQNKIALFIDADNAPASRIDFVLSEAAKYGVINIRRAYGNWKSPTLEPWEKVLHEYAIVPVQQFDLTKGKNASDIALVIDVMDTLYSRDVDVVCIVSSDCDFTPLVTRALADGKQVIGFGERKAPAAFVNACSSFLYLDQLKPASKDADSTVLNLKGDTKLMNLLRQAVNATADDEGWSALGAIGKHISNHASFDSRNYGFKKLSDLFKAIDLFSVDKHDNNYRVRDVRNKQLQR